MNLNEFYWQVTEQMPGKDQPSRVPVVVIDDEGHEHDIKSVRSQGGLVLIETTLTGPTVVRARSIAHACVSKDKPNLK